MPVAPLGLAAVVLAAAAANGEGEGDIALVATMVAAARGVGAEPVIVVLPRGVAAPVGARLAVVAVSAKPITAIRSGMALLANSSAQLALLWPFDGSQSAAFVEILPTLVAAAHGRRAPITAMAGSDVDRAPIIIARDSWLELMTIGEQGMNAIVARHGVEWVR